MSNSNSENMEEFLKSFSSGSELDRWMFEDVIAVMSIIQEAIYQTQNNNGEPDFALLSDIAVSIPVGRLAGGATVALYIVYQGLEAINPGSGAELFRTIQTAANARLASM